MNPVLVVLVTVVLWLTYRPQLSFGLRADRRGWSRAD